MNTPITTKARFLAAEAAEGQWVVKVVNVEVAAALERELAAMTEDRDRLRAEVERLKNETRRLNDANVEIRNLGIEHMQERDQTRAEVERLTEFGRSLTRGGAELIQQRDQWRECAEKLRGHLRDARDIVSTNLECKYEVNNWGRALAAYERLKGETK